MWSWIAQKAFILKNILSIFFSPEAMNLRNSPIISSPPWWIRLNNEDVNSTDPQIMLIVLRWVKFHSRLCRCFNACGNVIALTLRQWSSSGNPVIIQCAWNLDPSVHWNATGERIAGSQLALWRTAPGDAVLERSIENHCGKKLRRPRDTTRKLGH